MAQSAELLGAEMMVTTVATTAESMVIPEVVPVVPQGAGPVEGGCHARITLEVLPVTTPPGLKDFRPGNQTPGNEGGPPPGDNRVVQTKFPKNV
jgi:hypothetical protein